MYTMRSIAATLAAAPEFSGALRLYVSSREHEGIYAISDQEPSQLPFSEDVLYIVNWPVLQNLPHHQLPRNILCTNAVSLSRPALPPEHNIILTDAAITADQLRALLPGPSAQGECQTPYARQLLDALYSGSLQQLCDTASSLCGNPIAFLGFNYRTTAYCLLGCEDSNIVQICQNGALGSSLIAFLHDKNNKSLIASGAVLSAPDIPIRFLCKPIVQAGVHIASVLLMEDRVTISEEDFQLLSHVARCYLLLHPMLDSTGPTRLVYEYALVRALSDDYISEGEGIATRFTTLGYQLKDCLYVMVLNSAVEINAEDLRQHLNMLVGHARQIVGGNGLCTPLRDHIVVLLNLDNPAPLSKLLTDFRLFCSRNDLRAGLSPRFSDISQLRRHYRHALDAIGVGSFIWKDDVLYVFEDLRIYKFIATCARSFPLHDLIPDYMLKLINYDHENKSNLLETLYYYIYTVKNTKAAADLLHIHRNTLLYRLEKVRSILDVDLDDGDVFLHIMLAFKFLEFESGQNGRKLCFTPLTHKLNLPES